MSLADNSESVSLDEYLAAERASELRHEYIHGQVYAMTGGSLNHGQICANLLVAVHSAARAKGCRAYSGTTKLVIADSYVYYPDLMVVCGDTVGKDTETAPCLLAEVLSPSTRQNDLREKRAHYTQTDSLEAYLLLEAEAPYVEVYRRSRISGRWNSERYGMGETFSLLCPDVELVVNELYRGVVDIM